MAPDSAHESVLEFLNSPKSSRRAGDARCFACGSTLTPRSTTFFYGGQSWEVILRVCIKCHPAPHVSTDVPTSYDA